jgi:hypothetical protein
MDPLNRRHVGTLVVMVVALAWAMVAHSCPWEAVAGFASGFAAAIGTLRFIEDVGRRRERDEAMRRFVRPRYDKDGFGGWRPHDGNR